MRKRRRYCLYPFRILLRDVPDGGSGLRKHACMSAVASAGLGGLLRCTPYDRAWRLSAGGAVSCGSFFCRCPVPVGGGVRTEGLCAGTVAEGCRVAGNGIGCAAFICVMALIRIFSKDKNKIRDNIYCCYNKTYGIYLQKPMGDASVAYGRKTYQSYCIFYKPILYYC